MDIDDMDKILSRVDQLDESDQAEISARILNNIDPNLTNLLIFINMLEPNQKEELCIRFQDYMEKSNESN